MIFTTVLLTFFFFVESKILQQCLKKNKAEADVVTRFDPEYDEFNFQYNLRDMKFPRGFIAVKSTYDVKVALKCLIKNKLNFTVKSGGHSLEKFSFGEKSYWVIDLKYLDSVKLDKWKQIATVGAGITLGVLSQRLLNFGNYALTVGTCFSVGISGYTLGGGFGPFSRKYGLMLDRVAGYEMVNANGNVLNVNRWSHSDLFWALRGGGGGNFGVVTKFKLKVFETYPKVASVLIYYDLSSFIFAFSNWQRWVQSNPSNSIGCLIRFNPTGNYSRFEFVIHEENADLMNRNINDIKKYFPEMNDRDLLIGSHNETLQRVSIPYYTTNTSRISSKARCFYVSKFLCEEQIEIFVNSMVDLNVSIFLEMYTGRINEIGPSETAFCHRNSLYVLQYSVSTKPTPEDPFGSEAGKLLHVNLEKFRERVKFMINGEAYVNYIDTEERDPFKKYYCNNLQRLIEVKNKYDPKNNFRFPLSIPTGI